MGSPGTGALQPLPHAGSHPAKCMLLVLSPSEAKQAGELLQLPPHAAGHATALNVSPAAVPTPIISVSEFV